MAPAQTYSTGQCVPRREECPWLPICRGDLWVFFSRGEKVFGELLRTDQQRGFWTVEHGFAEFQWPPKADRPRCMWSGVATHNGGRYPSGVPACRGKSVCSGGPLATHSVFELDHQGQHARLGLRGIELCGAARLEGGGAGQARIRFFRRSMSDYRGGRGRLPGIAPVPHRNRARRCFWLAKINQIVCGPWPPTPTPAMFSVSLGGVNPRPRKRVWEQWRNAARHRRPTSVRERAARDFFLFCS